MIGNKEFIREFAAQLRDHNPISPLFPLTGVLWGKEVEYIVPNASATARRVANVLGISYDSDVTFVTSVLDYHVDYSTAHEITLPPITLPITSKHATLYNMGEAFTMLTGIRVRHDQYNNQSCGSHLHFSATDRYLMARMANWTMILSPLSVFLRSNPYHLTESNDIVFDIYAWRPRISHFASPPRYIDNMLVQNAPRGWRGLRPDNNPNSFYAVEINRYRKDAVTIEDRIPESHWLGDYAVLALSYVLANHVKPPIMLLSKIYSLVYDIRNGNGFLRWLENTELEYYLLYTDKRDWVHMSFYEFLEDLISIAEKDIRKLDSRLPPVVEGLLSPNDYYVWLYNKSMEWIPEKYAWLEDYARIYPTGMPTLYEDYTPPEEQESLDEEAEYYETVG